MKKDIKGTWKTINGILNKTKMKITFPKYLKRMAQCIQTRRIWQINLIHFFFTDIGPKL